MLIDLKAACDALKAADNILIIAHQKPDGDTLGGSFALLSALKAIGKKARVWCADGFSSYYGFIYGNYAPDESFEPGFTVTVDIASLPLIAKDWKRFEDKVDLCIDHHMSNTLYAGRTLLGVECAAVCELIRDVVTGLGVKITKHMADAIFTGITTDTGCFRYSNVTSKTHMAAAEMIKLGADHVKINKLMFDTKSRGLLMVEQMIIETAQFHFGGRCCVTFLPKDVTSRFMVREDELDGISSFAARIKGVVCGITIKESEDSRFRVSVRTASPYDAAKICMAFGGGGHLNAAGCSMKGSLDSVTSRLLEAAGNELNQKGAIT